MINVNSTVSNWQRASQPQQGTAFAAKAERLESDLVSLSGLDSSAQDRDPNAGNVDVLKRGSLRETENGFTMHVLRGTPGGPVFPQSVTDYTVDLKNNTVQVTDTNPVVIGPSYCSSPGGQTSYTLDFNGQGLINEKRGPVPSGTPHVSWGGPYREL